MSRCRSSNCFAISLLLALVVAFSGLKTQAADLHSHGGLAWQRISPNTEHSDGPVLYQIIFRSSATPGHIPAISPSHTLMDSPISVSGSGNTSSVAIGGLVIDSSGIVTFANGQGFPGLITSLNGQTGGVNLMGTNGLSISAGEGTVTVTSNAIASDIASTIVLRDGSGSFAANTLNLDGYLALPNTSSASAGVLSLGGTAFLHNYGVDNTFVGASAGNMTMTGGANSAFGALALQANTTGAFNVAFGNNALGANTTAQYNAAFGTDALKSNTTGNSNSAFGFQSLTANTAGAFNAAFGNGALSANTTGAFNTAFGNAALAANTTAGANSAFGNDALQNNTMGQLNVAVGENALIANTTGGDNSAFGTLTLSSNTSGGANVAVGENALANLATGSFNIAIGSGAGASLTAAESNNLYIGNVGVPGESGFLRIGTTGTQTAAFIAGISGATSANGVAVFVNSNGQLGTATSSRRYKEQIADQGSESDVLMKLRPVAFYYKPEYDATHTRQYGLVAEEVAKIAPDLVVFDKDGAPQTVRYHFVNAMLLNEVQKQQRLIEQQQKQLATQQQQIDRLNAALQNQQALQQAQLKQLMLRLAAVEKSVPSQTQLASAQ